MNNDTLLLTIEKEIDNEIKIIINKLEPEKLLIFLLIQQEITFSTLKDEITENKEKISECYSFTINLIKHYKEIKLHKLQNYNITEYISLKKDIIDKLVSLLLIKSNLIDFKIDFRLIFFSFLVSIPYFSTYLFNFETNLVLNLLVVGSFGIYFLGTIYFIYKKGLSYGNS